MATITHLFESHQRYEYGRMVSDDKVERVANLDYDASGRRVVISVMPSLSPKSAYLVGDNGVTLTYLGDDPDYKFEVECWTDNGTIKRLSVFRLDMGVEIRYLSSHQDAMIY